MGRRMLASRVKGKKEEGSAEQEETSEIPQEHLNTRRQRSLERAEKLLPGCCLLKSA